MGGYEVLPTHTEADGGGVNLETIAPCDFSPRRRACDEVLPAYTAADGGGVELEAMAP